MVNLSAIQEAIRQEQLDGWLFCTHHRRDTLSVRILEIPPNAHDTRQWYYFVPAAGEPVKMVHAIESGMLDHLPGEKRIYAGRERLVAYLAPLVRGKRIALQYSRDLPIISYIDHGTVLFLQEQGLEPVSSAPLVQRTLGLLDSAGIESHRLAGDELAQIVGSVWRRIQDAFAAGPSPALAEDAVQGWILEEFERRGMETDHPPIVAAGPHSADPHYGPQPGTGSLLRRGEVLVIDLWAKYRTEGAVYADITWTGFLDSRPDPEVERAFRAVSGSRDRGVAFIRERLAAGKAVSGADVDREVRKFLTDAGYGAYLKHRTGHGIDTEVHGSGANLDSTEFPDARLLLPGSCFSIEPGVYLDGRGERSFGIRCEIDVYIAKGEPVVSGAEPQHRLLLLS